MPASPFQPATNLTNFQTAVANTPTVQSTQAAASPAAIPTASTVPAPTQTQSTDVTTLGQPTVNPANLPQQPAYTPAPAPDLSTITSQADAPTASQGNYDSITNQIGALTGQLSGQTDYANNLQTQYNVPQLTATANDLTSNIANIQNQRNAVQQQLKNQYGSDASKGYLSFEQQSVDSELSAKQSAYASTLATINGQLSTAKSYIDTAVTNKYTPILNQINSLKEQAALVNNTLDKEQQKKLAVMQAQLQDRATQIASNKAISTTMLEKIAVAAANPGKPAPAYVVTQAQNAALSDNPASALAIISPYLNDPLQAQKEIADIQQSKASAAASYASAANSRADAQLKSSQAAAYGNPNLIAAVQNGQIDPTKVNSRNLPIMSAFANAHIDVNAAHIDAAASQKVISNLDQQAAQITQAGSALTSNMKLLASLSDKVNGLGIPAFDTNLNALKAKYSNQPDVVAYLGVLGTVRSEYAKYIARGTAVDDRIGAEAAQAIPAGVNGATLNQLHDTLVTEGTNVQQSIKEAKAGQWATLRGTDTTSSGGGTTVLTGPDGNQYNVPNEKVAAFKAAGGH